MLKPHLFLVFAFVLLVWIVATKAWRLLFGFVAALAVSCAIPLLFDAKVWQQYFAMMTSIHIMQVFIPTFEWRCVSSSTAMQWDCNLCRPCLDARRLWYFNRHRENWNWMQHGLLLLLVSDLCAPYGYFTDECILLPFILAGLYHSGKAAAVDPGAGRHQCGRAH